KRSVLVARETALSSIHLEEMLEARRLGAVLFPPVVAIFTRPKGVGDVVERSVRGMID
ncbi:hypothetical protein P154DRAFT_377326, partial [Amniculicola lignicola CBS 123094]